MKKDFQKWHTKKEILNGRKDMESIYFREKEIWWCAFGVNIGFEQDGKGEEFRRPALILKKFNRFIVLAVPLTTKIKEGNKYYVPCVINDGVARMAIISQVRLIDVKRFIDKMGVASKESFTEIKNAIKGML